MIKRDGLAQSLEEFARLNGYTPDVARRSWRLQGLLLLGADPPLPASDGPRVAPGVAVPVRLQYYGVPMLPSDVIEVERPHAVSGFGDATPPTCDRCGAILPPAYEECTR